MFDLDLVGWMVVALCAAMVGVSKTGIPGVGILVVPLMAAVLPARSSTGVLLGILILGDLFAATHYRHHAQWRHVLRLLPAAFAGIVAGYFALKVVTDQQLRPIIGGTVLAMLAVNYWRIRAGGQNQRIPSQWWFVVGLGFLAGVTTMMANAAGPVMTVYLLAMKLPKIEFVGTSAWFFFVVNWLQGAVQCRLGSDHRAVSEARPIDAALYRRRCSRRDISAQPHSAKGIQYYGPDFGRCRRR